MTRLQTPGNSNAKQALTSFDLYGCSRAKCTDVRLSRSSFRLPGLPSANRERPVSTSRDPYIPADFQDSLVPIGYKTSLSSQYKASMEFLQLMPWSATVSDTVTDFQDLQSQTILTSFDLPGLPRVTSTCI